ncbi:hypothetical protein [Flavobacterium sp.]|uniref:hypothetical protein n=1 Tax=Flavobacterium sp. TaxID=239 RepID=UPI0026143573|nr:hypothetical protein [Flavobacterium sp.]
MDTSILTVRQIESLRSSLCNRLIALSFGAGVDSTAMLVALKLADIKPDIITFADTGGEKPDTIAHIGKINDVLASWGWPTISICKKVPLEKTGYKDLYENCLKNETLPSLSYGRKNCSIKWKHVPQTNLIKGVKRGPNAIPPHAIWLEYEETGQRIIKLIGYDCGKADMRRSKNLPISCEDFDYIYPLQIIGWSRPDCVEAITQYLGAEFVPIKSACFFCPASKQWELFWLAAFHPDLLEKALLLERNAMTGKHSRFDKREFGATWEEFVLNESKFPSTTATVGLGRSFSWNQWARNNCVVDRDFTVYRDRLSCERFREMANLLRGKGEDNAQDNRGEKYKFIIPITPIEIELF